MNQEVVLKARELAQLIFNSEEYNAMRKAEDAATQDVNLTQVFAKYEEKRAQMEALTVQEAPDFEQMGALSRELEEIQASFNELPAAKVLQSSRKGFTDMMQQVNAELQKVLQPEHNHEGGCSGECSSCGGCHH